MKLRQFMSLVAAGLLLAGCAVEEAPGEVGSIIAVMERDETRTSVTDDGTFTWSTGDQVWLQTTDGNVAGTLSSGEGTPSASFSYGAYVGDMTGKAVYPYNSSHSISGNELSFVLPASYDLGSNLSNTNAAMYGVNVGGTIKFNHLAGVMRFVFKNVPVGTDKFQITLDKKINGEFMADLTETFPIIETSAAVSESEKTITLDFDALTSVSDICLFVTHILRSLHRKSANSTPPMSLAVLASWRIAPSRSGSEQVKGQAFDQLSSSQMSSPSSRQ